MLLAQQITKHEILLVIYFIVVIVVLLLLIVTFFFVFHKRKNTLLVQQALAAQKFQKALAESEHEIKEQTLKNIGMELHDNVGQLLSVAKMQLNMGIGLLNPDQKENFEDARETVGKSLTEIRSLSKVINGEVMAQWKLDDAIEEEVKRLNKSGGIKASFQVKGNAYEVDQKEKIIIFRILQECCSNVVKHACAKEIKIRAEYEAQLLSLYIEDNGKGFDMRTSKKGSGLINMQSRAALIDAQIDIQSTLDQGTIITLTYPPNYDTTESSISR